jgi:GNAT superfamily N-acetyltransferase
MRFSVRHAVPDDAPQLSQLARRAKAHWDYPSEWLAAWRPQLTIEPRYLIEHRVLVAESAGRLVGMCALEDRDTCWSLEHVWVDPGSMGQGVGRTLVQDGWWPKRTPMQQGSIVGWAPARSELSLHPCRVPPIASSRCSRSWWASLQGECRLVGEYRTCSSRSAKWKRCSGIP